MMGCLFEKRDNNNNNHNHHHYHRHQMINDNPFILVENFDKSIIAERIYINCQQRYFHSFQF